MEKGKKSGNPAALLPIAVFLVLYLGFGILFEYVLRIPMGFYKIPIVVIFLIALLTACIQNKGLSFEKKIEVMAKGIGDPNIVTMILIFMEAGIFVGVVGRSSAESVAYFILSMIPPQFSVAILFVISSLVSIAMGTSVGTITLIIPIGIAVSKVSGFALPLCMGSVIGGAMFGDNLSFISDTTIAACQGQGCKMQDKFKCNFWIAFPAAIAAFMLTLVLSLSSYSGGAVHESYSLLQIVPYILVLIGGVAGMNVFLVLLMGIVTGSVIMVLSGETVLTELLSSMGNGASGMFETTMIAILVSAICALIREYGGFEAILFGIRRVFRGKKGGMLGVGILVTLMDIATANNTVAIVISNPIAKAMALEYGISPRRTASLLDTFSCISQGIIPYGAQMLVALSVAAELGCTVNAFQIIPYLFYPFLLLFSSLIYIFLRKE